MTAEELMDELAADPEWVAGRERDDRERERRAAEHEAAAAPLKAALAAGGLEVDSVADLYNQRMNYSAVVPQLIEWFPRIDDPVVKETVARALTVRWARPHAARIMLDELRQLRDSKHRSLRFAVANALSEVADDSVFDEVVALIRDHEYSVAERGALARALANMQENRERAIHLLRELLAEDVGPHAVIGLGELRADEASGDVERFTNHERAWVRDAAKKALRKLDAGRVGQR